MGWQLQDVRDRLDYNPDTGYLLWKVRTGRGSRNDLAGKPAGSPHKDGYIAVQLGRQKYLAHRLIWLIVTGNWPVGEIDHKNRNRSDNRWCNLQDTSKEINQQNRGGVSGVDCVKKTGRWRARITVGRKCLFLGNFASRLEAESKYVEAKKVHHAGV